MSEYRPSDEHEESPAEIRGEIEQTRSEMSTTIDAIQQKLNPEVIKAQVQEAVQERVEEVKEHVQEVVQEHIEGAKGQVEDAITERVEGVKSQVREATVGRVETMVSSVSDSMSGMRGSGNTLLDTIQANPIPTALAGLGLGWFVANRRSHQSSTINAGYQGMTYDTDESSSVGDTLGNVAGNVKERVGQLAEDATDRVGTMKDEVGNRMSAMTSQSGNRPNNSNNNNSGMTGSSNNILDMMKANPIPTALISVGLGLLLADRQKGGGSTMSAGYRDTTHHSDDSSSVADTLSSVAGNAKERVGQLAESATDRVSSLKDQAGDRVGAITSQASDSVNTFADQALDGVNAFTDRTQGTVVHARGGFQQTLQENPLTIGAVAVALGLAAGLALPGTPVEDRAFGDARDNIVEQVQAKAQDTFQKVQQVAQDVQQTATQTAKESAQRQGIAQPGQ